MKKIKELTIKEAIKQGYTKYGFQNREWQLVNDLSDALTEIEEDEWEDIVLFQKKSLQPKISKERIAELLSDNIGDEDSDESGRDDDCVYETVKAIDFTDIAEKINKELEQHEYWTLTDIKLVR